MGQYSYIRKIFAYSSLVIFMIPIFILYAYINPWTEGVEALKEIYPDQSYFEIAASTKWHLGGRTDIARSYLVLPSDQIVRLVKYGNNVVEVSRVTKYGLVTLVSGILIPLVAFIYVKESLNCITDFWRSIPCWNDLCDCIRSV